jgi:UMF1 family MFS transporter
MHFSERAPTTASRKTPWHQILSWQLYDFADTIYSMNVYTRYFSLFIAAAFAKDATAFGWALTLANLLVALTSPLLGALSDASQRRMPFLRLFVLLCAIPTALIGLAPSPGLAVALFILSYIGYQSASTFYQALLPGIATPTNISKISGWGVAIGYIGTIAGVLATTLVVKGPADYAKAFPISAGLFILFALPCLFLVPDFAPATQRMTLDLKRAYGRVAGTFQNAKQYPGLLRFLWTDFLYENAVSAVVGFMAIYATKVVGFGESDLTTFVLFSTVFAIVFGFIFGPIVDKIGPKRSVLITLAIWLLSLPLVTFASTPAQLRLVGPLVGIGLAAVWTSSRTYLVALAPVEKSGEFFGLYSLSGKSAGVLGTGVWTLVLWLLTDRIGEAGALKGAVWVMWLFIVVAIFSVLKLPDVRPSRANVLERGA